MPEMKIILAVQSQLLREMFTRVFEKMEDYIVVQEIFNPILLGQNLNQTKIDWVLFSSMHHHGKLEWVDYLIRSHPSVCFADIALDRSQVTFRWLNNPDSEVSDLSLEEFIAILEAGCLCQTKQNDL
jgi:hypothetical protein